MTPQAVVEGASAWIIPCFCSVIHSNPCDLGIWLSTSQGWAQLPRIVYGCRDEKRGYSGYAPRALHPKAQAIGGILEEECRQLMQQFFREKR